MSQLFVSEFEDASFHLAYAERFVLMNWRHSFESKYIPQIEKLHHARVSQYPEGVIGLNIVEPGCSMPDSPSREAGNDMMTRTGATTRVVVLVMLDQGFAVSALQSVALRVLGLGGRVPIRNFREIESAVSWIHRAFPETPAPTELSQLIQQLRGRAA